MSITPDQLARVRLMAQDGAFANDDDRAAVVALLAERDELNRLLAWALDLMPLGRFQITPLTREWAEETRALLAPAAESEASDGD